MDWMISSGNREGGPLETQAHWGSCPPTPRLLLKYLWSQEEGDGHTHLSQGTEEVQGDNLSGGKVWSWPFHPTTFANTITSLLQILLKKKCYTPSLPNQFGKKMMDNMLFMLATQFWGSFHINRIYYYYNSGCPVFLIRFRIVPRAPG